MGETESPPGAVEVIEEAQDAAEGKRVSVGEIVGAIGYRSYGPIYILIGLISITPLGAVPGSPSVTGTLVILLGIQKLFGRRAPWLPERLKAISLSSSKYERALDHAKGIASRIDRLTRQRLCVLVREPVQRAIAAAVMLIGLSFYPFELLPFGADIPAVALLLIGIGMTAQDGLFLAVGLAAAPAPAVALLVLF